MSAKRTNNRSATTEKPVEKATGIRRLRRTGVYSAWGRDSDNNVLVERGSIPRAPHGSDVRYRCICKECGATSKWASRATAFRLAKHSHFCHKYVEVQEGWRIPGRVHTHD